MTEINIAFVGYRIFDGIIKVQAQNAVFENNRLVDDIRKVLPPRHENWRIPPELKNTSTEIFTWDCIRKHYFYRE